jgi:Mn2+/Fe2+ NRAMP family transporter
MRTQTLEKTDSATYYTDPYKRDPSFHLDPPETFRKRILYWGPGLVLTASVVGSGELIATTGLGARIGYLALWLILVSCIIKVAVQVVLARFAIFSGETSMAFLDKIPGPRWRASWFTWAWLLLITMVNLQQGAMLGGVAMVMNIFVPQLSVAVWAGIMAVITIMLLQSGKYGLVEKLSTIMVASFTLTTIICVAMLSNTPYEYTLSDIWSGLQFKLPASGAAIALAVFGITGIGTTELAYYPYWCIEKGYARAVGAFDGTDSWYRRAKGWITTMHWDAFLSMIIFTILTLAFYILGASVLHSQNLLPEGMEMIQTLSQMYTKVLGLGAFYLFLVGAFFALFSTIFVSVAANARIFTDCFHLLGFAKINTYEDRLKWNRLFVVLAPVLHFVLFLTFKLPFWMVIIAGTAQTVILPNLAFAALFLRYKRLDRRLAPSLLLDLMLWASCLVIVFVAFYGLYMQFAGD